MQERVDLSRLISGPSSRQARQPQPQAEAEAAEAETEQQQQHEFLARDLIVSELESRLCFGQSINYVINLE